MVRSWQHNNLGKTDPTRFKYLFKSPPLFRNRGSMGTEVTQARPESPGRSNGIQQVAERNTQPYIQRTRILQPAVQTTTSHSPPAPPAFCLDLGPEMKRERDNGEEGLDACYQSALTLLHWTRQHRTGQANSSSSFSPQSGPKIQPEGQV